MVTIDEIKSFLGLSGTTSYDGLLTTLEGYVQAEIEAVCDRSFELATYTDEIIDLRMSKFDQQNIPEIDVAKLQAIAFLKHYPIVSGVTLTHQGEELVADEDYLLDSNTGTVRFYTPISDFKDNLTATYQAGYSTVPDSLKLVALEGVRELFEATGTAKQGKIGRASCR